MRGTLPAIALLLASGIMYPGAAQAPPAEAPAHLVTAAPRAQRPYREALRLLHQGRLEEAAAGFRAALQRDAGCSLAALGLSRALHRAGNAPAAAEALQRATATLNHVDHREREFVEGWRRWLALQGQPDAERGRLLTELHLQLDRALALYPDDPELWLLRAEVAGSPLRAAPFTLAALRLQPGHPLAATYRAPRVAAPQLTPAATAPVPPPAVAPRLFEGLGQLSHPITTRRPEAQAFYEQGLRCFHSYVMPERVANSSFLCFQQAATLDPDCAMAYWGLSFGYGNAIKPLDAAHRALMLAQKHGTDREVRFCAARVLELGGPGQREQFLDALDAAIAAYPDDVELWVWRGKVWGSYGYGTGTLQGIPYFLAAHRLQPEHPAPNHELVHAYESIDRPALGWPYTWGYRRSAPNMPHANHMQAHLAMRLGRWQEAIDCTRASRRRSLEGYPELDPSHHIDTLVRALAHEGRFREAEAEPRAYREGLPWARLLMLKADCAGLAEWAAQRRAAGAADGYYMGALAALDRGDLSAAQPFVEYVERQWKANPQPNFYRYSEVKGRALALSEQPEQVEEGLKLLREAAARAVKDPGLHAWGGGSYVLEVWGETALRLQRWEEAEEAFHEALAHEHGSILGALGMQVVWEHRNRSDMAEHYAARAAAIWKDADEGALPRQLERLRRLGARSFSCPGAAP